MSTESSPLLVRAPPVGTFASEPAGCSRSPCPVVNALANHGYIARTGRNILMKDLNAAMGQIGMSALLGSIFAKPTYIEFQDPATVALRKSPGFLSRFWALIRNPYSFFSYFGCWRKGQVDERGRKVIDLGNLAIHGSIEHDISLTRRDIDQSQGNCAAQKDLIKALLASSSDGGETITTEDLGAFVKQCIQQQLIDNPGLTYGPDEHTVNCGQVALLMHCFGDGKSIRCSYIRAIFEEERLPWIEGWTRRKWWTMGIFEFFGAVKKIKAAVDLAF
ncbi:putative peroxidase [Xylariaceae sp. AK1471]|nr:putative peroxidase [Xylariaceae sp. AK1471]